MQKLFTARTLAGAGIAAPTRPDRIARALRALRRIRARGVRTLTATVVVSIRDGRGRTRTVRRAVRVRIR